MAAAGRRSFTRARWCARRRGLKHDGAPQPENLVSLPEPFQDPRPLMSHARWMPAALVCCALTLVTATAAPSGPPDLILAHGSVLTVDVHDSVGQALAIRDGKVLKVGSDAAILALKGPHTRVIDLKGRAATPGLIDSHA